MVSDKLELGFVIPPGFPDFPIRLSGDCPYPIHLIERIAQKKGKDKSMRKTRVMTVEIKPRIFARQWLNRLVLFIKQNVFGELEKKQEELDRQAIDVLRNWTGKKNDNTDGL